MLSMIAVQTMMGSVDSIYCWGSDGLDSIRSKAVHLRCGFADKMEICGWGRAYFYPVLKAF